MTTPAITKKLFKLNKALKKKEAAEQPSPLEVDLNQLINSPVNGPPTGGQLPVGGPNGQGTGLDERI